MESLEAVAMLRRHQVCLVYQTKVYEYESDLGSNEHYLSSSENKAWKCSGLCDMGALVWQRSRVEIQYRPEFLLGLISITAQVVFITAKIVFIFTSQFAVHLHDFHIFTVV